MKFQNFVDLNNGLLLYGYKNIGKATTYFIGNKELGNIEVLFQGYTNKLLENAMDYVKQIDEQLYEDYFFETGGYSSPVKSIKSAISQLEDKLELPGYFQYFIIVKDF